MTWRLAYQSAKVLLSYVIPYKVKVFREAIFEGDVQTIRQILADRPALVQQTVDADGNTALGLAIQLNEIEVIKVLLELGSDPNLANVFDGNHPLFLLAKLRPHENPRLVSLAGILLDAGSNPLHEIHHQADDTNRLDATQTPSFKETPLFCCIRFQNEDLLKVFIEYDVDINTSQAETFTTPLMVAATLGFNHMCDMLIDAGADVNARDWRGNTALHLAIQSSHEHRLDLIQTLLEHGATKDISNDEGDTPLMLAQRTDDDEACRRLFDEPLSRKTSSHIYEEVDDEKYPDLLSLI